MISGFRPFQGVIGATALEPPIILASRYLVEFVLQWWCLVPKFVSLRHQSTLEPGCQTFRSMGCPCAVSGMTSDRFHNIRPSFA